MDHMRHHQSKHSHTPDTSWQNVSNWYAQATEGKGHYYHQHIVIPGVLRLLKLKEHDSLLDLGCGSGVLGRTTPKHIRYLGIDISPTLIHTAMSQDKHPNHQYKVGDVTKPLTKHHTQDQLFSHVACILALQNIADPKQVIDEASRNLQPGGKCILVLNHPCFRIPRQSSWGVDETNKLQYRKIHRYMSPLQIPMTMHPGKGKKSPITWSYHFPLSDYVTWLTTAGFVITGMEEWTSDKMSVGKKRSMENMSRQEIPLFLCLLSEKLQQKGL